MRASELIEALRREVEIHGDLDVIVNPTMSTRDVERIEVLGTRLALTGRQAREL